MTAEQLRNSILQEAISGRLTQSDTSDWREITIGQLGTVVTGTTPSKQNKEYYGDDYPFYKPGDLDAGIYTVKASDGLSKVGYEHARQLPANSILVTCIGATIGKTGIIKREGSCNQQINAIIPDADCDSRFIYYLMISPDVQEVIKYKSYSTTLPILNKTQFSQLEVTLPPLAEQKRIVAKLEELLPIVEQYGKAQKELDELNAALPTRLRQSILQEAISGKLVPQNENDEPVDILFNHIQEEKLKLIKQNIIRKKEAVINAVKEDEIPFDIPSSWKWCHLEELVAILDGYRKPVSKHDREVGTYPYYGANGVLDYVRDYIFDGEYLLVGEDGSVITSYGNPIVNKASGKIWVNNHAHVLQECGKLGYYDYLFYALQAISIKKYIHGFMPKYSQGDLRKTMIPLPPLAEQERIVAKIEELFAEIDKMK